MSQETIDYIRLSLEHAPQNPGTLAPDLVGWMTPDRHFVCAKCAGRMMARGCRLPPGTEPIWKPRTMDGFCCGCDSK